MDEQVLIESMEEYLHDWIGEEGMDHTVIVNLYELGMCSCGYLED